MVHILCHVYKYTGISFQFFIYGITQQQEFTPTNKTYFDFFNVHLTSLSSSSPSWFQVVIAAMLLMKAMVIELCH